MKKYTKSVWLSTVLLLMLILHTSSTGYVKSESDYYPVMMERSELEKSVFYQSSPKEMTNPGKIYYHYPYIFVNERYKGIHIIDNSNPERPVNEGYIVAPGCLDIAVKENIVYIDNAVDLVAFDLNTKKEVERIRDVFPEPGSPFGHFYFPPGRKEDKIIVEWKTKKTND